MEIPADRHRKAGAPAIAILEISFRYVRKSIVRERYAAILGRVSDDPSRATEPFPALAVSTNNPDTGRMCARSGCANRLPPPGRSGRPALYCGDACRSAAHRARTAAHTPVVAEALR